MDEAICLPDCCNFRILGCLDFELIQGARPPAMSSGITILLEHILFGKGKHTNLQNLLLVLFSVSWKFESLLLFRLYC